MKLLQSIISFLQAFTFFGIMLILGSSLFYACTSSDTTPAKLAESHDGSLGKEAFPSKILWADADSTEVVFDFYVREKALSFQIDRSVTDLLLESSKNFTDSALLRVYMSLNLSNKLESREYVAPTFEPTLQLINIKKGITQDSDMFGMNYVDINIIAYLDSLIKKTDTLNNEIPINATTALNLISAWDTLPQNSIYNVMYKNATPTQDGRVKFYTFNQEDTKAILEKLTTKKSDIVYLHLGILYEQDSIPFRTIIHIDNPANFPGSIVDLNNPPLFEFASPCPKACGNQ